MASLALSDDELRRLAREPAPLLAAELAATSASTSAPDAWLTTREAAAYIGRSPAALHRLTAARAIPFEQSKPGGKCYFRRSDLDAWMRS